MDENSTIPHDESNGKRMATGQGEALPGDGEMSASESGAKTEPLDPTTVAAEEGNPLAEQLAAVEKERDEYLDQWRRSAAEFQNFRKREERLRLERERSANARLLKRLLPVLDDLQRAAAHVPEGLSDNDWVDGMLAIERKLWGVFEQEGVETVDSAPNTPFDPRVHEALTTQESDEVEPDHIVQELERGFRHRDTILRPARVIVAK